MKNPNALKTIGEVSKIIQVPISVIRFWEKKIKLISPIKKNGGIRYYNPNQISIIQRVKKLLYDEKYSIDGAQKVLAKKKKMKLKKKKLSMN